LLPQREILLLLIFHCHPTSLGQGYTQPMNDYKRLYLELKSRWKEYSILQEQLRKDRRIILLCACIVCLLIGPMAGIGGNQW